MRNLLLKITSTFEVYTFKNFEFRMREKKNLTFLKHYSNQQKIYGQSPLLFNFLLFFIFACLSYNLVFLGQFTYSGKFRRPPSRLRCHKTWKPPKSMVPLIMSTIMAVNIIKVCKTSVQTTPLMPPYYIKTKTTQFQLKTILNIIK